MIDLTTDTRPEKSGTPPRIIASGSSGQNPDKHAYRIRLEALISCRLQSPTFTKTVSGVFSYGFRYYMPETGRWINRDPIKENGGVNLYRFSGNNALLSIDRFGLIPIVPIIIGFAVLVGVATTYFVSRFRPRPLSSTEGRVSCDDICGLIYRTEATTRYLEESLTLSFSSLSGFLDHLEDRGLVRVGGFGEGVLEAGEELPPGERVLVDYFENPNSDLNIDPAAIRHPGVALAGKDTDEWIKLWGNAELERLTIMGELLSAEAGRRCCKC